ncbi:type II and III secretion system protein family protein [Polycladidibacter stylochi]|uniref:type II and III secretion system protein family protein n=1 Tax=Polycladidibacter stylochi TaxID=1807766 RepID=UPI000829DDF4|nr:type II and III secretion system protein family protein [Pseudovibrio stylochi]
MMKATKLLSRIFSAFICASVFMLAPIQSQAMQGVKIISLDSSYTAGAKGSLTANANSVDLPVGQSMIIETEEDIKDVLVSAPAIADATVKNKRRLFVFGNSLGSANLVIFGNGGKQLAAMTVRVVNDISSLRTLIRKLLPNSNIRIDAYQNNIILSGIALNALEAQRAQDIAEKFISEGGSVLNTINIAEKEQVQLRVTVAEVNREVIKQLGVKFSGSVGFGNSSISLNSNPGYNVNTTVNNATQLASNIISGNNSLTANVKALQRDGIAKMLAEPNLVAVSGENASFLAGGEFPVVVGWEDNKVSYEYKPFGVGLDFTPVVLSGGRIKVRIKTEVSELSSQGALSIGAVSVQALKVRRAESTVELPSGGTLVMAGLLREDYSQAMEGTPGLSDIPILGQLFKSRDFKQQQTELVIFVTPYIVRAVAASDLAKPTDNLTPPDDASSIFMDQLNRIYSDGDAPVKGKYHGDIGYIYE